MSGPGSRHSTRRSERDAGMHAVARVRGVREQDSRLGLQQALRELRVADARVTHLRSALLAAEDFTEGDLAAYVALRLRLQSIGDALGAARAEAEGSRTIAESAQAHWQRDRTRLEAVEQLLERRAVARREEAARAEARELDDIAGQLWQRRAESTGGRR